MSDPRVKRIIDDWWDQCVRRFPVLQGGLEDDLREAAVSLLSELRRWLGMEEEEPDEALQRAFRDMAHVVRVLGVDTTDALHAMAMLEDVLSESDLVDDPETLPDPHTRLRLALRQMLLETVAMNVELDARYYRERVDALELFSEVLAHEVGNRLGAARTATELLTDDGIQVGPERREALLELVSDGVDAALVSVEDVSSLMVAQARPGDDAAALGEVLRGVVRTVDPVARKEGVALQVPEKVPQVEVDPTRVRLVLANLILNAVRYSDPEKEERWVRVSTAVENGTVEICVEDNGIGIREEAQEYIFRYRKRGDGRDSRTGSGLGLAVVAEAIRQVGGSIDLESTVGEGSTFCVRVPREEEAAG